MREILLSFSQNKSMETQSLVKLSSMKKNNCSKDQIIIVNPPLNKIHKINKLILIKFKLYSTMTLLNNFLPFNQLIKVPKNLFNSSTLMYIQNIISNTISHSKKPMILPHLNTIKTQILTIGFFKMENGKSLEINLFSPINKSLPNKKMSSNSFLNNLALMLWLEKIL